MYMKSEATNWILLSATIVIALSSIYYFINLTNSEAEQIASALATQNILSKPNPSTAGENAPAGAVFKTNYGEIEIAFRKDGAPLAVANFIKLARAGFYDGTKFHRVIAGFMIQGGDPLSKDDSLKERWGTGGPGYAFPDELSRQEKYPQGTLAMANSGPDTNGSQFFIVTANPEAPLSPDYTVFGRVTRGLDTALKIEKVATEGKGIYDRPVKDVILESVTLK